MKLIFKASVLIIVLLVIQPTFIAAQSDTSISKGVIKKRFIPLVVTVGVTYGAAWIALNELWYKNYPKSSFHFFNDNHEWLQIDKLGHAQTAFQESRFGVDLLKWSGVSEKKSIIYGSLTGFIFQMPIELFDGYSAEYGASVGDIAANTFGSALVMSQYLAWKELRIYMKYSFHQTRFASIRPNTLGDGLAQELLKDYNGQTYWLCGNVSSFLKKESKFPKWFNIALGYGGHEMVYAEKSDNELNGFNQYRQYYLSIDFDLTKIKTRSAFLRKVFYTANMIHMPAPALEFNKKGLKFHPLYF